MITLGKQKNGWFVGIIPAGKRMGIYMWHDSFGFSRPSRMIFKGHNMSMGQPLITKRDLVMGYLRQMPRFDNKGFPYLAKSAMNIWNDEILPEMDEDHIARLYKWQISARASIYHGMCYLGDDYMKLEEDNKLAAYIVSRAPGNIRLRKIRRAIRRGIDDAIRESLVFKSVYGNVDNAIAAIKIIDCLPRHAAGIANSGILSVKAKRTARLLDIAGDINLQGIGAWSITKLVKDKDLTWDWKEHVFRRTVERRVPQESWDLVFRMYKELGYAAADDFDYKLIKTLYDIYKVASDKPEIDRQYESIFGIHEHIHTENMYVVPMNNMSNLARFAVSTQTDDGWERVNRLVSSGRIDAYLVFRKDSGIYIGTIVVKPLLSGGMPEVYITDLHGDWAEEAKDIREELYDAIYRTHFGKKKIGAMEVIPVDASIRRNK